VEKAFKAQSGAIIVILALVDNKALKEAEREPRGE
jgi:hypothetical protein